jgi:general secretion pathway protein D
LGNLVNLGNGTSQYEFGERSAETVLNIRDGETVIIGGMIRDDNRTSVSKVPGLGDIPVLGKLFSDTAKNKVTTDIMLTITPHIVRALETPSKQDLTFWSGTEETYSTKPLFSETSTEGEFKETPNPPPAPSSAPAPTTPSIPSQPEPRLQNGQGQAGPSAILTLKPVEATASLNQEVSFAAEIQNAKDLTEANVSLSYDPKVLKFKRAVEGSFMKGDGHETAFVTADNPVDGIINLRIRRMANSGGAEGSGTLFDLSFASKAVGSSTILFQPSQFLGPAQEPLSVSFVSGRIIVK